MAWFAKPRGIYGYDSAEGKENIYELRNFFGGKDYTLECIAGICGNVYSESGLNPWRWQDDTVDLNAGYGLFQYTPASDYIDDCTDVPFYSPNLSTVSVTSSASPSDALAQLSVFQTNRLLKWQDYCWRDYWSTTEYADLWTARRTILDTYGDGSSLSMREFARINDIYLATFAFLACFEGPRVPNMEARYTFATDIYEILQTQPPKPIAPRTNKSQLNSKWAVYAAYRNRGR